jgi:hypothetical protein
MPRVKNKQGTNATHGKWKREQSKIAIQYSRRIDGYQMV